MQYEIRTRCEAIIEETWTLEWPHDEEPTEDEVEEMMLLADGALTHVRDRTVGEEQDRTITSIAAVQFA